MWQPSFTTIITPLIPDRVEAVRCYLRKYAEPRFDARTLLQCQERFRFDRISGLHFCSFVVLEGDAEFAPCLVFEATFDGERGDFLRELWRVAPEGMHEIYANCIGYPQSGLAVPELIEGYLTRHESGAQTYFLGSPGRLVSQIQGESRIRSELVSYLSRQSSMANAMTLAALQHTVQREIIRGCPQNSWAEQPAALPWEMTYRGLIAAAAVLVALVAMCGVGMLVVAALLAKGPAALGACLHAVFNQTWQLGIWLTHADTLGLGWLGGLITQLQLPVLPLVIALAAIWAVVRLFELVLRRVTDNPRDQFFIWRFPLHVLMTFKYALPIFLIGFVVLGVYRGGPGALLEMPTQPSQLQVLIHHLDKPLTGATQPGEITPVPSLLVTSALLVGIGLIWLGLYYWATSLRLAVELQELKRLSEDWRRFLLDVVRFAMLIAGVTAALAIARHIPTSVAELVGDGVVPLTYVVLVIAVYVVTGILAAYAVALCLFLLARARERTDRARLREDGGPGNASRRQCTRIMPARRAASTGTRTIWRALPMSSRALCGAGSSGRPCL